MYKIHSPIPVISGAPRGFGKGCALELARGGFNLLINDRPDADSVEKLHITQQECLAEGVEVICFPANVGDLSLMKRCSTTTTKTHKKTNNTNNPYHTPNSHPLFLKKYYNQQK